MSKQDRQGVRTAQALEQKYNLGDIGKQGGELGKQNMQMSQLTQMVSQFMATTNAEIAKLNKQIETQSGSWKSAFPVGSIYMSVDSTEPAELFGFGTWEQIKDTFLLSAGDTYKGGTTGGEAAHTLTVDELPKHTHKVACGVAGATASTTMLAMPEDSFKSRSSEWEAPAQDFVLETGGDEAHNNMPPYLAVYVWKRTK